MSLNVEVLGNESMPIVDRENKNSVNSLAQQWAKKYLQNIQIDDGSEERNDVLSLSEVVSSTGRQRTANKIMESLRTVSAKAWNKTEALLSTQIKQHNINPNLINPWEVAGDSFKIYQKTLDVYTQQTTHRPLSLVMNQLVESNSLDGTAPDIYTEQIAPNKLATVIGADIGAMRNKYTSVDPRVIGFVSMQFHYTSQMLIQPLEPLERSLVSAYFKVIDDHLYMPLQRAYEAAANHDYNSPAMSAVQRLLPMSSQIAKKICHRVIEIYPSYSSMSGILSDPIVKVSSVRDVEMFQVYLWVCALEESVASIQQELFPLCVMLYPRLKVHWELVRQMLHLLGQEIQHCLTPEQCKTLMPYFQVLWDMFSPDVLS
ncbi:hypothetical protein ACN23B_04175 [Anabaena sp. FACHB-709]|uniref:Uncharacterized protein n=2 Tax=Nostocaceae TaxID=1162 RepID=A0A1Z4KS45_ANAVA|nr:MULTISPECIES: hypothetical protein [Nostocaceae]BAY71808.1 hypothetical protein NIES23_46300 [Trichormus variabilis NIES-23]HBW33717.1 hypothetical protein [Nostoc sp. UBA8866]MBD2172285.1 hypothetical protein [Anabaena cylindrica FACHB-318]MBD2263894.1 hypothetical protein [Anabaena sp. FACHB-709]MBD2273225.1 hypothetical protein [Nostoc sp. PCC 7120 = FACHB-418]